MQINKEYIRFLEISRYTVEKDLQNLVTLINFLMNKKFENTKDEDLRISVLNSFLKKDG